MGDFENFFAAANLAKTPVLAINLFEYFANLIRDYKILLTTNSS